MGEARHPRIGVRLLPLLDIVFILLAFFVILPQGFESKEATNLPLAEQTSQKQALLPAKYLHCFLTQGGMKVEYLRIRQGRLIPHTTFFPYKKKKGWTSIPPGFLHLLQKVRSQIRAILPQEDLFLVILLDPQKGGWREMELRLVSFAEKNQIGYVVALAPSL